MYIHPGDERHVIHGDDAARKAGSMLGEEWREGPAGVTSVRDGRKSYSSRVVHFEADTPDEVVRASFGKELGIGVHEWYK